MVGECGIQVLSDPMSSSFSICAGDHQQSAPDPSVLTVVGDNSDPVSAVTITTSWSSSWLPASRELSLGRKKFIFADNKLILVTVRIYKKVAASLNLCHILA